MIAMVATPAKEDESEPPVGKANPHVVERFFTPANRAIISDVAKPDGALADVLNAYKAEYILDSGDEIDYDRTSLPISAASATVSSEDPERLAFAAWLKAFNPRDYTGYIHTRDPDLDPLLDWIEIYGVSYPAPQRMHRARIIQRVSDPVTGKVQRYPVYALRREKTMTPDQWISHGHVQIKDWSETGLRRAKKLAKRKDQEMREMRKLKGRSEIEDVPVPDLLLRRPPNVMFFLRNPDGYIETKSWKEPWPHGIVDKVAKTVNDVQRRQACDKLNTAKATGAGVGNIVGISPRMFQEYVSTRTTKRFFETLPLSSRLEVFKGQKRRHDLSLNGYKDVLVHSETRVAVGDSDEELSTRGSVQEPEPIQGPKPAPKRKKRALSNKQRKRLRKRAKRNESRRSGIVVDGVYVADGAKSQTLVGQAQFREGEIAGLDDLPEMEETEKCNQSAATAPDEVLVPDEISEDELQRDYSGLQQKLYSRYEAGASSPSKVLQGRRMTQKIWEAMFGQMMGGPATDLVPVDEQVQFTLEPGGFYTLRVDDPMTLDVLKHLIPKREKELNFLKSVFLSSVVSQKGLESWVDSYPDVNIDGLIQDWNERESVALDESDHLEACNAATHQKHLASLRTKERLRRFNRKKFFAKSRAIEATRESLALANAYEGIRNYQIAQNRQRFFIRSRVIETLKSPARAARKARQSRRAYLRDLDRQLRRRSYAYLYEIRQIQKKVSIWDVNLIADLRARYHAWRDNEIVLDRLRKVLGYPWQSSVIEERARTAAETKALIEHELAAEQESVPADVKKQTTGVVLDRRRHFAAGYHEYQCAMHDKRRVERLNATITPKNVLTITGVDRRKLISGDYVTPLRDLIRKYETSYKSGSDKTMDGQNAAHMDEDSIVTTGIIDRVTSVAQKLRRHRAHREKFVA